MNQLELDQQIFPSDVAHDDEFESAVATSATRSQMFPLRSNLHLRVLSHKAKMFLSFFVA